MTALSRQASARSSALTCMTENAFDHSRLNKMTVRATIAGDSVRANTKREDCK